MKQLLKSELNGTELFKKIVMFLLAFIACIIGAYSMLLKENYVGYTIILLILLVSSYALQFNIISNVINAVSLDNKKFSFTGSFGSFMVMCIKGVLLTLVSFGVYGAWFEKNVVTYIASNTEYPEKEIKFNGTGGKLFKYMILSFIIPLIIFIVLLVVNFSSTFMSLSSGSFNEEAILGSMVGFLIIYVTGIFLIASIYIFYVYKWVINFTFGNQEITFYSDPLKTILYFIGQLLLTIVTLGIYAIAADIKIIRKVITNVKITDTTANTETRVYFNGKVLQGFFFILLQYICTFITLGIYLPWAYAKIFNWYISNIEIGEDEVNLIS